jgi:uncharacterized membrane protein
MGLRDFAHHHIMGFLIGLLCFWLSLCLIIRLWLAHKYDPFPKKLLWSLVLCVPLFGWLAYGAFYTPLSENDVKAESRDLSM